MFRRFAKRRHTRSTRHAGPVPSTDLMREIAIARIRIR